MYFPDTAILVTRYLSEGGVAELVDFMPIEQPGIATDRHRLVRGIRGVRGTVEFEVRIEPRFDYGRQSHRTEVNGTTARFETTALSLDLTSTWPLEHHGSDVRARFTVEAGDLGGMVLESGADGHPTVFGGGEVARLFEDTMTYWQNWVRRGTYRGRWREAVYRSAITLKLMTYAPSGALVAAPTAGLPEQVGGERNWDYRYTWIRDGSFSVYALLGLGFTDEAVGFTTWLRDRVEERRKDGETPLNIMYRVDGSSDLDEYTLDHWEGYRGSSPVRIGNGAAEQLQLDIYGEAMDSIYFIDQGPFGVADDGWNELVGDAGLAVSRTGTNPTKASGRRAAAANPSSTDDSCRGSRFDRAIRMATKRSRPADLPRVGQRARSHLSSHHGQGLERRT